MYTISNQIVCLACGYELSKVELAVCPECGTNCAGFARERRLCRDWNLLVFLIGLLFVANAVFDTIRIESYIYSSRQIAAAAARDVSFQESWASIAVEIGKRVCVRWILALQLVSGAILMAVVLVPRLQMIVNKRKWLIALIVFMVLMANAIDNVIWLLS